MENLTVSSLLACTEISGLGTFSLNLTILLILLATLLLSLSETVVIFSNNDRFSILSIISPFDLLYAVMILL